MRTFFKRIFPVLLLGIILGAVAGVALSRPFCHMKGGYGHRLSRFVDELDLNSEQQSQVRGVLDEQRQKIRTLREETRPRFEQIRQETRLRIRQYLTPAQQKKFDELENERKKKFDTKLMSPH